MSEATELNILDMSDEELMKLDPATLNQDPAQEEQANEEVTNEEVTDTSEADATDTEAAGDPVAEATDDEAPKVTGSTDGEAEQVEKKPVEAAETKEEVPDYKAVYDRLTTPFKANGRDIQVKSVDDAISLMQMGANYNKKMAALKPNLKLMKLLENNGLLSEEKLSYLIDLEKKNPDAISKLIKESGIDPLELDTEKAGDYRPTTRTVDDREIELDTVLDEMQDSPTYTKTLDVVSNKWDPASKQVIANAPQLLKVIDSHVQTGIYDQIVAEMESERLFGRLQGLSDIEAYRQVGDMIQARGGFSHLVQNQGQQTPTKPVVVQPKPKSADEDKRREKKLAAGISKPAASAKRAEDFNPLALSDDEFAKLVNSKYL